MAFNQFSTGFILGAVIAGLAAALFARCPAHEGTANGAQVLPFRQRGQYGRTGTEG